MSLASKSFLQEEHVVVVVMVSYLVVSLYIRSFFFFISLTVKAMAAKEIKHIVLSAGSSTKNAKPETNIPI